MTINQGKKSGRGRPVRTAILRLPDELYNRLNLFGFFDIMLHFDGAENAPPEAVDFEFLDRFKAAFVRYGQMHHRDWQATAAALGRSWRQYKRYLSGEIVVPEKQRNQLATVSGVSEEWIATGRGQDYGARDGTASGLRWYAARKSQERQRGSVQSPLVGAALDDGLVAVRKLAWRASAGTGSLAIEWTDEKASFPKIILDSIPLNPDDATMLVASGNSMAPTIIDGEILIVDTSIDARLQLIDGRVYAFLVGDEGFVKRLRREPEGLVMASDNPAFPDRLVPRHETMIVVGRIRWVGHLI